MAARSLPRCAAGMEDRHAFFRRQTGQLKLLEGRGRHRWNLGPAVDFVRRGLAAQTKPPIRLDMRELQREERQSQFVEPGLAPIGGVDELAQARVVFAK